MKNISEEELQKNVLIPISKFIVWRMDWMNSEEIHNAY